MTSVRAPLQMPNRLALFPLSGVVLLPFGHIPLNIFEPRYINMIDDVLGGSRIIGVIQPREHQDPPLDENIPLFEVGTAGRIIQFSDPGNGRYLITLEGMARFRLCPGANHRDDDRGYRLADVDYSSFLNDQNATDQENGPGREKILDLMKSYFNNHDIQTDWQTVSEAPYQALVSSLAMSCPFQAMEKQALLECTSHSERAKMLISLFEMNAGGDAGSVKH